jgi:hypothetical protein
MSITLVVPVVFFCLYWLFIRFITNHKNALAKPEEEQRKFKKQLYLGMVIAVIAYIGSQLMLYSKTTAWIPWLGITCYLFIWGIGGYLIRQAYRLGIKNEIALVKKSNGQQFSNPHKFIRSIARVNLLTGLLVWLFAIAIPIFKIKMTTWAPYIVIITGIKQIALSRFEKNDAD